MCLVNHGKGLVFAGLRSRPMVYYHVGGLLVCFGKELAKLVFVSNRISWVVFVSNRISCIGVVEKKSHGTRFLSDIFSKT